MLECVVALIFVYMAVGYMAGSAAVRQLERAGLIYGYQKSTTFIKVFFLWPVYMFI